MSRYVYLDYNATTPLAPEVLGAMLPYFRDDYGNPSSIHRLGRRARAALGRARENVAELVGGSPEEIVLTGGGTEADNLAILGTTAAAERGGRRHLVASNVEHHAVLAPLRRLEKRGWELTLVPVDGRGRVAPETLRAALRSDTLLVSVMVANNETGVVQPIRELAGLAHDAGAWFHTDAVQACGKLTVDVGSLEVDLLSLSAHKFYGPKGVGALYVRDGVSFEPMVHGGGQEWTRRPGTENVPGVVGLAEASRRVRALLEEERERLARFRDELEADVLERIPGSHVNGSGVERTPNTVNLRFDDVDGRALVTALDEAGFGVSTGAACDAGATGSHVLLAMGLDRDAVQGSIRVSLGRYTREPEVRAFSRALQTAVDAVRSRRHFTETG